MYQTLEIERQGRVATVWMNRPDVHNAFDETLIAELTAACEALDADASVRVVVLAGRGKSFSAGADLNWMKRAAQNGVEENLRDARALACAEENLTRLHCEHSVRLVAADLYPEGRAPLVVCNPPWLPAKPSSPVERAVYDPDSRMLKGFLADLAAHLAPGGEGWLILSDLAEHLGLRTRDDLQGWIAAAGLRVAGRLDIRPQHGKVFDRFDPLHEARAKELTSLWRLAAA